MITGARPRRADVLDLPVNRALFLTAPESETATDVFMALGVQKSHLPFAAPKPYWDNYKGQTTLPSFSTGLISSFRNVVGNSGEL